MFRSLWKVTREAIRRYFVAGLLAFAPIAITFWAVIFIITRLDNLLLPHLIQFLFPSLQEPPALPPLVGALFTFIVILFAGVLVRHFFGQELVRIGERLLSRVPVARSIYYGVKQLFEAILSSADHKKGFNRVVLLEYPRRGMWGIAFVTGETVGPLERAFPDQKMLNCFIPTTPNPTSGFYLLVPAEETREVDLSVEDAFKVIMSAGLVTPDPHLDQPDLPGLEQRPTDHSASRESGGV